MRVVQWPRLGRLDYLNGSEGNDPIAVKFKGDKVLMLVQNGGDFGDSEVVGTPEDARALARALLNAAARAEAQL